MDCIEHGGPAGRNDRACDDRSTSLGDYGAREREDKKALARAASTLRSGDGLDDSAEFVFLDAPSEAAVRAVSVEVDGDPRGGVRLFFCGHDGARENAVDPGRGCDFCYGGNRNGLYPKNLVGFRRYSGAA